MSDKTEQLKELFLKISSSTKVIEKQAKLHGDLKGSEEIERRLREVVSDMCERYSIQTKLTPEQLATLVRLFYKGLSDTEIAEGLGDRALNKTVSRARIKLHLFRRSDLKPPLKSRSFSGLLQPAIP
jgi:DNA-binding NarL/FixJ family response regulator